MRSHSKMIYSDLIRSSTKRLPPWTCLMYLASAVCKVNNALHLTFNMDPAHAFGFEPAIVCCCCFGGHRCCSVLHLVQICGLEPGCC